jgi:hypothetical protein
LAAVNNLVQNTHLSGTLLDERECSLVLQAGIEFLDDFMMVSAAKLHAWTGIPLDRIRLLYRKVEVLIAEFHTRNRREIDEIWEMRQAARIFI